MGSMNDADDRPYVSIKRARIHVDVNKVIRLPILVPITVINIGWKACII